MVDDVDNAVAFYTNHFGFTLRSSAAPAFADVVRGNLRLLLSGPASSAGRPMPDGRTPQPGGWNRIHFIVDALGADVERLRAAGVTFRNDIVTGPGGQQVLLEDPSGNPIELFVPAPEWLGPTRPRTAPVGRGRASRRCCGNGDASAASASVDRPPTSSCSESSASRRNDGSGRPSSKTRWRPAICSPDPPPPSCRSSARGGSAAGSAQWLAEWLSFSRV